MKKLIIIFILLFFPLIVNAENCNNEIYIDSIKVESKTAGVTEKEEAKVKGLNIYLDLSMSEIGNNIKYKIVVKNNSKEKYDINDLTNINAKSDYFKYKIISNNDSNIIKPNSSKELDLEIEYANNILNKDFKNGTFNENKAFYLDITNNRLNPNTSNNCFMILIIILLCLINITIYKNRKNKILKASVFVLISIPIVVNAACKYEIKIDANIEVKKDMVKNCTYNEGTIQPGTVFNDGNFEYHFRQDDESIYENGWANFSQDMPDGWGFVYHNDYYNSNGEPEQICTTINGMPIVSAKGAFFEINIDNIDFSTFDTSHIVNMDGMFYGSESTKIVDFSGFDTSNVTDMYNMFKEAEFDQLDLSYWDISNVETISYTFYSMKVNNLNISNWDLSNVKTMDNTFERIDTPKLDISTWDTSNVTSMFRAFAGITLDTLDISNFDYSSLTNDSSHFSGYNGIFADSKYKTLKLGNPVFNHLTKFDSVFSGAEIDNLDTESISIPNVKSMETTFYNAKIKNLDLSIFKNLNSLETLRSTFNKYEADELDLTGFNTSHVISLESTFGYSKIGDLDLTELNLSNVTNMTSMFRNSNIGNLKIYSTNKLENTTRMFDGSTINNLDLSGMNTTNVTNMREMFAGANISTIDLSSFTLNDSVNMYAMFNNCNATTGYAKDQASANKFNNKNTTKIPDTLHFEVK